MKSDPLPSLTFDDLRLRGIKTAQDTSGKIWTDYNLHDPGVTLLEQTAFALTEVGYQSDHDVRDLLTSTNGKTDFVQLALFPPHHVLAGRPVTLADLSAYLSDLDGVERVFARSGTKPGLVNLLVIPAQYDTPNRTALLAKVRVAYEAVRMLCSDVDQLQIARRRPVHLAGNIQLSPLADPDRVAAELIYCTRHLLRGLQPFHGRSSDGATRNAAFEDPATLWPALLDDRSASLRFDSILAKIKDIPGVVEVTGFDVLAVKTAPSVAEVSGTDILDAGIGHPIADIPYDPDVYYDPASPSAAALARLILMRDAAPVMLDADVITEELGRLEAAEVAAKSNRKDQTDWDVIASGRHRPMQRPVVDTSLPALYHHKPPVEVPHGRARHAAQNQLAAYRRIADVAVGVTVAPIATVPDNFSIVSPVDFSDPAQIRKRVDVLDYLIGLQGEEMPPVPDAIHCYRGARERARWAISWREGYLTLLSRLSQKPGAEFTRFGLSARLALLADFQGAAQIIDADLVRADPDANPPKPTIDPMADARRSTLDAGSARSSIALMDILVVRDNTHNTLSAAEVLACCPWVTDGMTTPDLFRRAAMSEAYAIFPAEGGGFELQFDPGQGQLRYPCIRVDDNAVWAGSRTALQKRANRIRRTFQYLNAQAERLIIIEDIRLRQKDPQDFTPAVAHVLVPGWTVRTADPAYRQYFSDLVLRWAPAHIHAKLRWLGPDEWEKATRAYRGWVSKEADSAASLRAVLNDLDAAT